MSTSIDFDLDSRTKGIPVSAGRFAASTIAEEQFVPALGTLQYPVLTMDESAFASSVSAMMAFCRLNNALLAQHGKTSMAPELAMMAMIDGNIGKVHRAGQGSKGGLCVRR